jgi:hypothetical protein
MRSLVVPGSESGCGPAAAGAPDGHQKGPFRGMVKSIFIHENVSGERECISGILLKLMT